MVDPEEIQSVAFAYYPRLKKVKEHVDQHLEDEISLATAARIAGLEEKYFSTFFHRKTGICFTDWITRARIMRATDMMSVQDYTITGIAFAVGFRELRTFERAFKKFTGMTPRAFKSSVRPKQNKQS